MTEPGSMGPPADSPAPSGHRSPEVDEPRLQLPGLPVVDWDRVGAEAPVPIDEHLDPNAPLPKVDIVIITWTVPEWAALDHIFVHSYRPLPQQAVADDSWREGWVPYRRGYDEVASRLPTKAPSLTQRAWGSIRRVRFARSGRDVLLVKSDMHLTTGGVDIPLRDFVARICREAKPRLLITTGTAGGTRLVDGLGSVVLTGSAHLQLTGDDFSHLPFNGHTYQSERPPTAEDVARVEQLLMEAPCTWDDLKTLAQGVPGCDVSQLVNAANEPGNIPPRTRVSDEPVLTDNGYPVGTTDGNLEQYAALEMDDALVAMECIANDTPFAVARSISDPVLNASLSPRQLTQWSKLVYSTYGLYTSFNGALCAWALADKYQSTPSSVPHTNVAPTKTQRNQMPGLHAYIAGPMFNEGEQWWSAQLDEVARKCGLTSYLNSRDAMALAQPDDVLPIFKSDCREILRADLVIASLNGLAVGSGTAWEIAWAYANGKHIVGVYTDWRLHYKWQTVNLMVQCSLDKIVRSLDDLESYLKMWIRNETGHPAGGGPIMPHQQPNAGGHGTSADFGHSQGGS